MAKFSKIERWDATRYIIQYNPVEVEREGEKATEFADYILVEKISKAAIVEALIRKRYTISDELGLLRQAEAKPVEFAEYNAFAEAMKTLADTILNEI